MTPVQTWQSNTHMTPTENPADLGHVRLEPAGPFTVRDNVCLTVTFTAGRFGIDDTGAVKLAYRLVSDMGALQTDDPTAPNYVSAEAGNGARLDVRYDPFGHVRPWDQALIVRVMDGCLAEGDTIVIRLGDRSGGSPGLRLPTFRHDAFVLRAFVDAIATGIYTELPDRLAFRLDAGEPVRWKAVLPTARPVGEPFRLGLKAEDLWGNPTDRADILLRLEAEGPLAGLPGEIRFAPGRRAVILDGLSGMAPGTARVRVSDAGGNLLCESNPVVIGEGPESRSFWGDLHGQSGETVGSGTARDYFAFARDIAFLDVVGHQGNDFEITNAFWRELNALTAEFDDAGRFVCFPGYEWSGNTCVGGDHNVLFAEDGRPIRRSSHALVPDEGDMATDCHTAGQLFEALRGEDAVVLAHVGGRYADITAFHDATLETAVEIHSAWGTFEWLLFDAIEAGHRVGVVCNSDDHKCRPGASYPGASEFGSYGGLTCFLTDTLSRAAIFDALRRRHHYGTTGARIFLDVRSGAQVMGDIVPVRRGDSVPLSVRVAGAAPIERVEVFAGHRRVAIRRPFSVPGDAPRLRVLWEGAHYRGRSRQVTWDGSLGFSEATIKRFVPINQWNPERPFVLADGRLTWSSMTTGSFAGCDLWLDDATRGGIDLATPLVTASLRLADIGEAETVIEAGGLERRVRVSRLPETLTQRDMAFAIDVPVEAGGDTPVFVRVTQEDGHRAWSSPLYLTTEG